MGNPGRHVFAVVAAVIACSTFPIFACLAQSYPLKPIRILVGFAAGGAGGTAAHLIAQKLPEHLGQPVVVLYRPGAGGVIATETVAKSPPDGYTLLMMVSADAVQPALRTKLPYDLEHDLAAVSLIGIAPFVVVVHPLVPARNVRELIALARSRPNRLTYGSSGVGSSAHLAGELLNSIARVAFAHVPYKGSTEAAIATAAGHIDMSFPSVTGALSLLEAGKVKPLAVTSAKRASSIPSIPTLDESGVPGYDWSWWGGVLAPAGVPKDIIIRLNVVIGKTVNNLAMRESLNKLGLEPQTSTSEQFRTFIHDKIVQSARLIKLAGVKAE